MTDPAETRVLLGDWSKTLTDALEVSALSVDVDAVLALAADAAHTVVRPAAPLTTFIVGYAAGVAAASGVSPEVAVREASEVALRLCRERAAQPPM